MARNFLTLSRSNLLEFSLGGLSSRDKNVLNSGRFYYVKSFYNNFGILEDKSNSFCEWCDSITRDFKKEFLLKYSKENPFLFSKSAIQWIDQNKAQEFGGGNNGLPLPSS